MITAEYVATETARAKAEFEAAHQRAAEAKTKKARRAAYEGVEFWGNKLAFYTNVKY